MKKTFTFILFIVTINNLICQVNQLEFSDFDNWKDIYSLTAPAGKYQEPLGSTCATSNEASMTAQSLPLVKKTDIRYGGEYAALLETRLIFSKIASGTLFTGRFILDIINPINSAKFGVSFIYKPVYLRGFYKYIPVDNDSCRIASFLTRWNSDSHIRDTIAIATISYEQSKQMVTSYTEFDIVYDYKSSATPDSITVMFSSSAGGANLQGGVGTQLYIDEVTLEYYPLSIQRFIGESKVRIFPNPVTDYLILDAENDLNSSTFRIYNTLGNMIEKRKLLTGKNEIQISDLPNGVYFYSIERPNGINESGKFIKK
jgi:hypothetical protein